VIIIALFGAPVFPVIISAIRSGDPASALAAQDSSGQPPSPAPPTEPAARPVGDEAEAAARLRALVDGLADPSFAVRERSTRELLAAGEDALPELRRGLDSQDPELRRRAEGLIDEIARRSAPPGGAAGSGLDRSLRDLPERADPAFEAAVKRLDEIFRRFDRSFLADDPHFPESILERPELAELERRIAEMRERLGRGLPSFPELDPFAPFGPGESPFSGEDAFGAGRSRIQIWRDGEKVLDRSSETSFADAPLLGVVVESLHPAFRAHLPIPEGQGVLISGVAPGSRAERTGLLVHDILLTAGGTPIGDAVSLRRALGEASGEEIELGILRGGEPSRLLVDLAGASK